MTSGVRPRGTKLGSSFRSCAGPSTEEHSARCSGAGPQQADLPLPTLQPQNGPGGKPLEGGAFSSAFDLEARQVKGQTVFLPRRQFQVCDSLLSPFAPTAACSVPVGSRSTGQGGRPQGKCRALEGTSGCRLLSRSTRGDRASGVCGPPRAPVWDSYNVTSDHAATVQGGTAVKRRLVKRPGSRLRVSGSWAPLSSVRRVCTKFMESTL